MAKLIFIVLALVALAAGAPKPFGMGMGIGHGISHHSTHHVGHMGYGMMGYPMMGMMGYPGLIGKVWNVPKNWDGNGNDGINLEQLELFFISPQLVIITFFVRI
ncbi:unnamed protein product [Orchesella dallaii]|uniref:Uncharacterized protein n=1 Tax=Orchesella dallaii TaxID=48710 RepID=A0ABP1RUJ4_9HEXA